MSITFKALQNGLDHVGTVNPSGDLLSVNTDLQTLYNDANGNKLSTPSAKANLATEIYKAQKASALIQQWGSTTPYRNDVSYILHARVTNSTDGKIYRSKIPNNLGNLLTDTNSWELESTDIQITDRKRFSVNESTADINGYANFIQKDSEDQHTILAGATNKLIFTSYNGITKTIESNVVKTGLSALIDGIYNIIYDYTTDTVEFELQSKFTESFNAPSGGVDGDYWIRTNPLQTYKKIAGVWTLYAFVNLGENTKTGGVWSSSPISYALNGLSTINNITIPANGIFTSINDNLGSDEVVQYFEIVCIGADQGFATGQKAIPSCYDTNAADAPPQSRVNRNTAGFVTGQGGFYIQSKAVAGTRSINRTQWVARFVNRRVY